MRAHDAEQADRASAGGSPELPPVIVYREMLLNYNEPYIRTQAEAVPRYRSHYVGTRRVRPGIELPPERTIVLRDRYRRVDAILNHLARRVPARGPLRTLARGDLAARSAERLFQRLGVSPYLERRIRALQPVLLHAHTGVSGAHALPLARRLGLPLVVTFHGYDATATEEELYRWPARGRVFLRRRAELQRVTARAIAVSAFLRDELLRKGWAPERVVVHYLGVDTRLFRPDPAARPLAERDPVIFFAGRLIEKKGLEHLIDAARLVLERVPDAEVVIAGVGPLRAALERRAAEARTRVRFVGRATQEEVRGWLSRAQVYCMPSVRAADGDSEGVPVAIQEAMACGVPVVATVHAGIPEAVVHGETGLLAPERDSMTLAAHLMALLGDAALRTRMGGAARERILERFDHRRQAAILAALYDEVRAEGR